MLTLNQINSMNLNSNAVVSMLQDANYESLVSLKLALRNCRFEMDNEHYEQPNISWTTRAVTLPGDSQTSACGAFAVFTGAFVFVQTDEGKCAPTTDRMNNHLIPAVLLYNMGLCHHQEAIRYSGGCAIGFDMARKCYSHALILFEAVSEEIRQTDLLVLAALTNNMACIANFFCDANNTKIFGKMLSDILDHTDVENQLDEEDAHVIFSLNVMIVAELNLHGVAPAA